MKFFVFRYCVLLGNGQMFPPRFLFHGSAGSYTCILSMPANCPIRDDIIVCLKSVIENINEIFLFI